MFRWSIKGQLLRGKRPGIGLKRGGQVPKATVDGWIQKAKTEFGIQSIICLLEESQLKCYEKLTVDLITYYKQKGFAVVHIPAPKKLPVSNAHLEEVWNAYQKMEKPVLVHCSVGIGRTGMAVRYIKAKIVKSGK